MVVVLDSDDYVTSVAMVTDASLATDGALVIEGRSWECGSGIPGISAGEYFNANHNSWIA